MEGGNGVTVSLSYEGARGSVCYFCSKKYDGRATCCCKISCAEVSSGILSSGASMEAIDSPNSVTVC